MGIILIIVLVLILLGGLGPIAGGNFYGQGPFLGGGLGLVLAIVLVLVLLGHI